MTRILAFDTSLGAPGVGLIEVKKRKATIIDVSHVKTASTQPFSLRTKIVEAWATMFVEAHVKKGFDIIGREDFHGMSSQQNYPVFAAWSATDRAVNSFELTFDKYVYYTKTGKRKTGHGVAQSRAKKLVVGKGSASKEEVEEAVRAMTGYKGEFAKDDESDAVCIALAFAIQAGLIDDVHGELNEHDKGDF